ncbi:hypothetical protein PGTUg99_031576 [Puccinia graminis f. sp. tritici]|uniref:Uncharacterized protein n=1 Tax=Puccinia graminis f. sp. tritici TaxID=56615 RepID=A0A5B0S7N0_PUCGR|nr:hypothetical protein PGTUg99_031576 [Puccinia graminis f. sp. tritici]
MHNAGQCGISSPVPRGKRRHPRSLHIAVRNPDHQAVACLVDVTLDIKSEEGCLPKRGKFHVTATIDKTVVDRGKSNRTVLVKLVSTAGKSYASGPPHDYTKEAQRLSTGTGFFYTTTKVRTAERKIARMKYDPRGVNSSSHRVLFTILMSILTAFLLIRCPINRPKSVT